MAALAAAAVFGVLGAGVNFQTALADRHSPPQPDTPAEDNPVPHEQGANWNNGGNRGACVASTEAGIVGLNGVPYENCYEALASTSGRDDNNEEGCYEQVQARALQVPDSLGDKDRGVAYFDCGLPSEQNKADN